VRAPDTNAAGRKSQTNATDAATNRKWCRSCASFMPIAGGALSAGKVRYWRCAGCNRRRTEGGEARK